MIENAVFVTFRYQPLKLTTLCEKIADILEFPVLRDHIRRKSGASGLKAPYLKTTKKLITPSKIVRLG